MPENYYLIGRPINGISLNGNEWLQDEKGRLRLFKGKSNAKTYLKKQIEAAGDIISDDEIEDNFVFAIASTEEIINGAITSAE